MKTTMFLMRAAACAVALGWITQGVAGELQQPAGVARTSHEYDNYVDAGVLDFMAAPAPGGASTSSPSDQKGAAPTPTPATAPAPAASAAESVAACQTCEPCDGPSSRWCRCGELGDAWRLPQTDLAKRWNLTYGGWVQGGIYTNAHGAPNNGPLGFNNRTDLNLHQLWGFVERKPDAEKNGIDLGGRMDYVFGIDGPDTQSFGDGSWDFGWNSSVDANGNPIYGSAIPQLYAELAFGNWTIKGGHFYTPHGFEVVPATGNFFYSHSYMMYYAEPFTHTGFLATYKSCDHLSFFGGWVAGWDSGFSNLNGADMFLGGVNWMISEKASLLWSLTAGNFGTGLALGGTAATGDLYFNSLVFNYKLSERWTYVFQHDLATNVANGIAGGAQWYGVSNYLLYKINDCWQAGGRLEWFRDEDGVRVPPFGGGDYYEATLGLNYKPHANCLIRPEIRYDWYNGPGGAGGVMPYDLGTKAGQFAGGCDVIFTF